MLHSKAEKVNFQQINSNKNILTVNDYHLIKKSRIISVEKLHCRDLYSFFTTNVEHYPVS